MTRQDEAKLIAGLTDVYGYYRVDLTPGTIRTWATAMNAYSVDAVLDALGRHAMNPDTGQFVPKIADVVKMISGSTKDAALIGWSNVDKAVRQVGPWQSVAFDDPIIHRVIHDMGGWVKMATGAATEKDWVFVGNEFENRYRGYLIRSDLGEFPSVLVGQTAVHNATCGGPLPVPMLIGDPQAAMQVVAGGVANARVGMTRMTEDQMAALPVEQNSQPQRLR